MNQDLIRINKLSLYSTLVLAAIGTASYFVFTRGIFLAIIISEAVALIVFIITLIIYYMLSRSKSKNLAAFAVSFVILFTLFLNIEIFFIYKKILFK